MSKQYLKIGTKEWRVACFRINELIEKGMVNLTEEENDEYNLLLSSLTDDETITIAIYRDDRDFIYEKVKGKTMKDKIRVLLEGHPGRIK